MKNISHLTICFAIVLCWNIGRPATVTAQVTYKAGFGEVSIEPGTYPFSLALAGYGAPREGRFTLQWTKEGDITISALAGAGNSLYCISGNSVMKAVAGKPVVWQPLATADNMKLLAAGGNKLYAIDINGNLFYSSTKRSLKWKKKGTVSNIISFTADDGNLYFLDNKGSISAASAGDKKNTLKPIAQLAGLKNIAVYKANLYGITADDDLFEIAINNTGQRKWVKIARYNALNDNIHIQAITVAGNRLYGTDNIGIYSSANSSDGTLTVSALAIGLGNTKVVLMAADLCGFHADFTDQVKDEAARLYHIPTNALLMNASHTHFAPVSQPWLTWGEPNQLPDSDYLYGIIKPAMIKAIGLAIKNMTPSNIYFGRGTTAIGGNRSLPTAPLPYDNTLDVLTVENTQNKTQTVLFLTGCHPVFNNSGIEGVTITANYPGVTRNLLKLNKNITGAMFIQGCAGDINPIKANHTETGQDLANDVKNVLNRDNKKLSGLINYHLDTINLPVQKWSVEQITAFKKQNVGKADVDAEKNVRWADLMLNKMAKNQVADSMPVYVQTINIGGWKLVGLSREAVTDYSTGIKNLWPDKLISVAGYCNDVPSYLPTEKHIKAHTYEGDDSFFWYAQPSVFPINVYQTILTSIKNKQR